MAYKLFTLSSALLFLFCDVGLPGPNQPVMNLPALETFCIKPVELENVGIWVPAAKSVPMINRSCMARTNCSFSSVLPATIEHTKAQSCPEQVARLLAEHTAPYHEDSLPLTIFNGWQWEYTFSLCRFESVSYELPGGGGCWESSWEAILTQSCGVSSFVWVRVPSEGTPARSHTEDNAGSQIDVRTFSSMRTRDGYPKERDF